MNEPAAGPATCNKRGGQNQRVVLVLSEYQDLSCALRYAGEAVMAVRRAEDAIIFLKDHRPARLVFDTHCYRAEAVLAYMAQRYPECRPEPHTEVIDSLLDN